VSGRLWWLAGGAALLVAFLVLLPFFSKPSGGSGPQAIVGRPVPVIPLQDVDGAAVSLSRYRGEIAIVNLWATWCPPCRAEMPDLQRIDERYGSRGVAIVGIDQGESAQRARAFARSLRIGYPIWIDDAQQYGRAFGALGLPTTVIVGRNGVVARAFDGPLTYDDLRRALEGLLAPS